MELFISYSRADLEQVQTLVDILREGAHNPWFDQKLLVGQDWKEELGRAIDKSDAFVYALSINSVDSEWCQWEFARAVKKGKPIIPVRVSDQLALESLPAALKGKHVAEFTKSNSTNVARLMGGLNNLTVTIKPEDVPNAPEYPQGRPALADQSTTDTGKFQLKVTRHHPASPDELDDIDPDTEVMTAEFGLPRQYRLIIMLGVGALIFGTIFGALSLLPIGCDYGLDFTCPSATETLTATVTLMPSATSTVTNTPTITLTTTHTATPTVTSTPSLTATNTSVPTETAIAIDTILPPTPCEAEILERVVVDNEDADNEALLVAFNDWLICGEFPALAINTRLTNIAGRQRSYLSTLGRDQLDTINPYVDAENRGVEEQARIVGYDGLVEMIVVLQEDTITFADVNEVLQARGIELERYTEIGFDVDFDPAVNLYYLVIAIGFSDNQ